jgi:hypothetical protein
VDFPIPGSLSRTTNGIARKSLTRSIERSPFPSPSMTLTRRSISAETKAMSGRTIEMGWYRRKPGQVLPGLITVLQFAGCRPKQSSLIPIRLILFGFGVGV